MAIKGMVELEGVPGMSEIKSSQSFGSFVILGILGIGFRGVVYSITGPNDHTVYLVKMKEVDRSHQADDC